MEYVINTIYNDANHIVEKVGKWKKSHVGYRYATFRCKRTSKLMQLSTFELKTLQDIKEGDYSNI